MSSTRADFFAKIAADPELQKQVADISHPEVEKAAESLAAIAQQAGFALTAADFLPENGELSEAELSGVAGGAPGDVHLYKEGGRDWQWQGTENAEGKFDKLIKVPRVK